MMVLTLFGAASCITDPEFKPADITVSATTLEFSAEGGSATLELLSNRDWTLEVVGEEVTWLAVSMISAEASETSREIRISTLPLDGVTRQAILKFKTETVYASVRVTQKGNVSSAVTSFSDDFSSIEEANVAYAGEGWNFYSSDPSDVYYGWRTGVYNSDKYIQIAPYSSAQSEVEAYATMPLLNVRDAAQKTLSFQLALYYKEEDASKLEVVASTDFAGDYAAATWTVVYDATFPAGSSMNTWKTHTVNLEEAFGDVAEVHFAFRYTGKSNTYRLDNVIFGTPEHMNGGNEGNGDDPGNTNPGGGEGDGIYTSNLALPTGDSSADAHYLVKVIVDGAEYPALKLGKSEAGGTYTVGNLPATGDVTLTFYGVAWKGKSCDLTIAVNNGGQIDGASSKTLSLVPNQGATQNTPFTITFGDKDFYTLSLTGVTESTTLTFSTPDAKPRCILTGLNIK